MKFVKQPNRWTCGPASFAMCMDVTLDDMLGMVGHDGSQIVYPEKDEPCNRVAFDAWELVLAAFRFGFAAVELPVRVASLIPGVELNPHWPVGNDFWNVFPPQQRFVVVIKSETLEGQYHCVAWQRDQPFYYDPMTGEKPLPFAQPIVYVIAVTRINNVE